jgi:molybdopterin converting factor small subunit
MKITVRVFGRYKDITGKEQVQLEILEGNTLWHVVDAFVQRYPAAKKDKKFMMVSKNKMYVSYDTMITKGDDITLSPPVVSGG